MLLLKHLNVRIYNRIDDEWVESINWTESSLLQWFPFIWEAVSHKRYASPLAINSMGTELDFLVYLILAHISACEFRHSSFNVALLIYISGQLCHLNHSVTGGRALPL